MKKEASPMVSIDFLKTSGVRSDMGPMNDGLTRQEFAEECDINTIMKRYEAGGAVSHVNRVEPVYLDTTLYPGLQASMDAFREAEASFKALPALVRREFDNDAEQFVAFCSDSKNLDKLREWGLAKPLEKEPGPVRVEVVAGGEKLAEGYVAPAATK